MPTAERYQRPRPAETPAAVGRALLAAALLVIVTLVGVGAWFTAGAWHTRSIVRPAAGWIITTGAVVAIQTSPNTDGDYYYSPVITYQPPNGHRLRMTGPSTLNRPRLYDTVKVAFDPRSPTDAHDLSAPQADWIGPLAVGVVLIFLGAVVLPAGIWTVKRRIHRWRSAVMLDGRRSGRSRRRAAPPG